jgi:putative ABC transport system permease protein
VSGRALGRLLAAELRGRRLRAMALLLLVVVLAAAALVAGLGTQSRAGDSWDYAFAEANGAHIAIDSTEPEVLAEAVRDPRIVAATRPYRALEGGVELRSAGDREDVLLREMGRDDFPAIGRPLLRDGRWAAAGATDELVIDRAYGLERGIEVGERVTLNQAGREVPFVVVGRALDLVDCFYPLCDPIPAWADPAGFARLSDTDAYGAVFARVRDPQAVSALVTDLEDRFGADISSNDWLDTRDDALILSGFFGAFLAGFGVFVMVAAAIVVLGSMASRVIARRRDIGLLKAVGVTPRQVTFTVLVAHAVVAAVGVVLGWVLGGIVSGRLQLRTGEILGDTGASFPLSRLLVALVVIEAIVLAAIVVPAWRTGRLSTTAALAPAAPRRTHRSRLARLAERVGLGPVGTSGVRDAFARPARSLFTVLALTVAIVAVIVSMGVNRTIADAFDDSAKTGDPYDVVVASPDDDADRARVTAALDGDDAITSWYTITQRKGTIEHASYLVRGLGGDVEGAGYVVESGRMPRAADEAIVGYGLLQELDVAEGDDVTMRIGGAPTTFRIVGWYRDTEDNGQVLMTTLAGLQRAEPDATPDGFFAHVRDGRSPEPVAAGLQRELAGVAQVTVNEFAGSSEIDAFRTTFWLFTLLVLVVAFANLGSTLLLAVRERSRDLGVLRSVGFTPRQVLGVTAIGAAVLAGIAAVVGVPLGLLAFDALIGAIGATAGIGPEIGVPPPPLVIALVVPVAIGAAALLGTGATRRAATAEVSDLVRYE